MTPIQQGFIDKCTQHGVNPQQLIEKNAARLDQLFKSLKSPLMDGITTSVGNRSKFPVLTHAREHLNALVQGQRGMTEDYLEGVARLGTLMRRTSDRPDEIGSIAKELNIFRNGQHNVVAGQDALNRFSSL